MEKVKLYLIRNWHRLLLALGFVGLAKYFGGAAAFPVAVLAIDDFGEQFASKVLRKVFQRAVYPAITNSDYEGEISKPGDRVNILMFLHDVAISDYSAGTDMGTQTLFDTTDELTISQQKYYNWSFDKTEQLFTYAGDIPEALIENGAKDLERILDRFVMSKAGDAKAGNWVGTDFRVVASAGDTQASIATTATGGTVSLQTAGGTTGATVENPRTGTSLFSGFTTADIGKPIRLTSGATWATSWYRITAVTDSNTASIANWDDATQGEGIPVGDILRGLYGDPDFTGGATNGDGKPTTAAGWGWEFQAAEATSLTGSAVYEQLTLLSEVLDKNEVPDMDRHVTGPPEMKTAILQASELQPSGIEMIYENTVINGKVARAAGFDVHVAAGSRMSTRAAHATSTGQDEDVVTTTGTSTNLILANHISFLTFAYKWAESRVVDAENQFAKKYQGLHLYGAKVPILRRKAGAVLFATL